MDQFGYKRSSSAAPEGSCTAAELQRWVAAGIITRNSLISADGQTWYAAPQVRGLLLTMAVGFCFIPFFNLYWTVYMPYELARTIPMYLGRRPGADKSGSVLAFQVLAIVPGSCIWGLQLLFYALTMRQIQTGLNHLWLMSEGGSAVPAREVD